MVSGYCKSKEGVKEYEKIGLKYPDDLSDKAYDEYLKQTRKSPKDKTKVEIMNMKRVVLFDGSQWIVHDHHDIRLDMIGNLRTWYRGGIGKYPIVTPRYEIKVDDETFEKSRVCTGVSHIKTGWLIPFTKKKADELHDKYCLDVPSEYSSNTKTAYSVQRGENRGPGNVVSVQSYKDWRDAEDIEELFRFGKIANPAERQLLAEEKAGKVVSPYLQTRPYT